MSEFVDAKIWCNHTCYVVLCCWYSGHVMGGSAVCCTMSRHLLSYASWTGLADYCTSHGLLLVILMIVT